MAPLKCLVASVFAAAVVFSVAVGDPLEPDHARTEGIANVWTRQAPSITGCDALAALAPNKVFFPGTPTYEYEHGEFWSVTELMDPGCVFRPTSAQDVSKAVKTLAKAGAQFAVRGGGHMGIRGSNNIDAPGVLMVMSNLTTLELCQDKSTLKLGPGYRWGAVYEYLAKHDLTVAGGRLSPVGVPGLLLGGGINFHGNQVGFSADTVVSYEVVLGDGTIVSATAKKNRDLFWALKGGSSNFGIVTQFEMKTIPSKQVWAGILTYAEENIGEVFEAIATYSANIEDPLSHIIPAAVPAEAGSVFVVIMFYDSETISYPECFAPFFAIPTIGNTMAFKTVSQFANENGALVVEDIADVFAAGTVVGKTYDQLLQGIQITNDTFYAHLPSLYAAIPKENIVIIQLNWQPIGDLWLGASARNGVNGNPLGLNSKKGTYLAYAEVVEWIGSQYDDFVYAWIENTTNAINSATQNAGLYDAFNYMGDATGFQEVYAGYGAPNQNRLLEISRKYDSKRIFQTLVPGGFKIGV